MLPATTTILGGSGGGLDNDVIGGGSNVATNNYTVQRSASLKDHRQLRYNKDL